MSRAIRQHLSTRAPDSRRRAAGRRAQTAPESGERGFVLLEEIVSITLLMIVMAALATFFITVTQSTTYERARQSAVQLANTEMDAVTAVSATDLCSGRTPLTETAQFAGAPPTVAAALQTTQPACGSTTSGSTLTLPTATSAVANNITYTLTNYLGNCWVPTVPTLGTACTNTPAAIAAGTPYVRAVVSATWAGNHCPRVNGAGLCTYVTSSLISASDDPTFNLCTLGSVCGPAPPQLINPGNQASLVNSTVSLQLSLVAYTGVAPITWFAAGLPSWLTLNTATGLITGTAPSTPAAAVTVTVTATDAFARTTQAVFTWAVVAPPTITGLTTPYTAIAGIPIASQTLPYTCPTSSCTYTLAGAPSGIGLATTSGGVGAATQTVANTSGTLYLVGTPAISVLPSSTAYAADVANQGATNYWRLDETSGTTGVDSISGSTNAPLTEQAGVGHGAAGAVLTSGDAADTFDGAAVGVASTTTPVVGPQTFSEEIWFKTTTTSGGKLMGFGNQPSGLSDLYDRQIYMDNAGHIDFGVCGDSCPAVVTTSGTYNDGQWHQAVGTLTSSGITLYVDGQQIGTNTGVHSAYPLPAGYWRLGGDNLNAWPAQPISSYFAGALDEASVYPTALTLAQVQQQYSDSGRVPFTVTATPQDLVTGAAGVVDQAAWTVIPVALPSITGLTTPFATTAGATITSQPLPYTCATTSVSCTYTLAGAPSGIGLALTPTGIGQPSQTVLNSSGTLYAVGTVSSSVAPSSTAYANDVRNQGATNYWRLNEASGATAVDSIGGNSLLEQSGVGHGVAGAILSSPDTAATFDGSTAGYAAEQTLVPAPGDFSESIWFRTLTTSGGKLIGFASSNSSPSVANDRHIYMDNTGHLRFGTWANGPQVIATPGTYNDGQWHQAVGTFSVAGGMTFYVDGVPIGSNPANIPYPQAGYWRIGGDSLAAATWPGTYSSIYFQGTLDDASIYARALTAAQIQQQYADSGRVPFALTATPKDQTTGQTGLVDLAAWTIYSPPTVSGLTTPFVTSVGATITSQPLPYNCPLGACTYALTGAPAGIGLSLTAGGNPTGSVSVSATVGAIYLVGTVGTGVTPGNFTVTVRPTDTASGVTGPPATAAWTVGSATVSGLTNPFSTTVGATITSQPLPFTCPSLSCTYTVTGVPTGIGLDTDNVGAVSNVVTVTGTASGTIFLRGTVGAVTPGTYTVVVTPRDTANNATGTPIQATWTVYAPPTVTGLNNPFTTSANATIASQTLPDTCPSGSCTLTVAGNPTGIGLSTAPGGVAATSITVTGPTSGNVYLVGKVGAAAGSSAGYATDVVSQGATNIWHLDETSGTSGADAKGGTPLTESAGVGHGVSGAIATAPGTAATFDGSSLGTARSQVRIAAPTTFTESIWFKTTTTLGGQLIGFGDSNTDARSGSHDRQVYLDTSGHLFFGVSPVGGVATVAQSTGTFNDGTWHQAVATMKSGPGGGMTLYVDGKQVGSQATTTTTVAYTGYWRLGGDDLTGWPSGPASNFTGSLDEASIYSTTALTAAQVATQYADAYSTPYTLTVTPADTSSAVSGTANQASWRVSPAPTVSGLTSPFATTVGATIATQTLAYSCPTGSCTFAAAGLPANVGISTTATGGSLGTTATVTSSTGGVLYLRGTVGAGVTPGTYNVTVTPTDTVYGASGTASSSTWSVYAAPTVNGLVTPFSTTAGAVLVGQPLPYTCPASSCTYTVAGAPTGVGLDTDNVGPVSTSLTVTGSTSGTIYLRGTVAAAAAPSSTAYAADVRSQGASNYWRLNETSGTTGVDSIGSLPLTEQAGVGHRVGGGIASNSDTASTFDGSSADGAASTQTAITGPQVFSESVWFNTTTTSGGRLLGFGNTTPANGVSSNYDRQVYMDNAGHLSFGVCANSCPVTVATSGTYNDGQWHQAVGTLSSAGLSFYVDGSLVGTNTSITTAQVFNGYWRLGGDNLNGWPGTISSQYFAGTLDDVSIYPTALTAAQIQQQYADSGRVPYSVTVTPADTASGIQGAVNQAAWTVYSPPVVTGLTTPFAVTAGATVPNQTLPYSCPGGLCTFALTGAPAGVGVSTSSTGAVSTTVTVTAPSGVLYLRGTVSATAATGATAVALTPTDTSSGVVGTASQATWTVSAGPTTAGLPSGFGLAVGEVVPNVAVTYTCPTASCTLALNAAAPAGLVLATGTGGGSATSVSVNATSGTVYVSGTISSSATLGPYAVSVVPTDNVSGAVGVATTGTGTIYAAPTVSGQTTPLRTSVGATIANDALSYTCPSGSCTFTVANAPSGIGLYSSTTTTAPTTAVTSLAVTATSGTIYLRGTILASTGLGNSTVTVTPTATDPASGISTNGPVSSAAWTLVAAMSVGSPGTLTTSRLAVVSKTFTSTCRTTACTVSVTGAPPGIGLSATAVVGAASSVSVNAGSGTLYLQGVVSALATSGTYPIILTITDPAGSTVSSSVTWTVS